LESSAEATPVVLRRQAAAADDRSAAALCTLDMLAVLCQLRSIAALLHMLWRLLTADGAVGAHARRAAAGCPRLLAALLEAALHRWAGLLHALQLCFFEARTDNTRSRFVCVPLPTEAAGTASPKAVFLVGVPAVMPHPCTASGCASPSSWVQLGPTT
jgi:hypothetical protein